MAYMRVMCGAGLVVVGAVAIACADKPSSEKGVSATAVKRPATGSAAGPKQVTYTNYCAISPAKDGAPSDLHANAVIIDAVLDGVYSHKNDQILVSVHCEYVSGKSRPLDGQKLHTWDCKSNALGVGFPPYIIGQDIRGNPELEGWYGKKPQPIVYSVDESENVLRIDEFNIQGPGTLAVNCAKDRTKNEYAPFKGCRISWYNKFVPDETHYTGACAETVTVRGVFQTDDVRDN